MSFDRYPLPGKLPKNLALIERLTPRASSPVSATQKMLRESLIGTTVVIAPLPAPIPPLGHLPLGLVGRRRQLILGTCLLIIILSLGLWALNGLSSSYPCAFSSFDPAQIHFMSA